MGNLVKFTYPDGELPPLTDEQRREIISAANRPINYDDIPPLTEEQLSRMVRISELERRKRA